MISLSYLLILREISYAQWSAIIKLNGNGNHFPLHVEYTKEQCCLVGNMVPQSTQDLAASYISRTEYGFERYTGMENINVRWLSLGY